MSTLILVYFDPDNAFKGAACRVLGGACDHSRAASQLCPCPYAPRIIASSGLGMRLGREPSHAPPICVN